MPIELCSNCLIFVDGTLFNVLHYWNVNGARSLAVFFFSDRATLQNTILLLISVVNQGAISRKPYRIWNESGKKFRSAKPLGLFSEDTLHIPTDIQAKLACCPDVLSAS